MASTLFDLAAERLEQHSSFSRLEARGTVRLALKEAGLDPERLTAGELSVVFDKVMVEELEARGVRDAAQACRRVMADVSTSQNAEDARSASHPDEVFRRLAGE